MPTTDSMESPRSIIEAADAEAIETRWLRIERVAAAIGRSLSQTWRLVRAGEIRRTYLHGRLVVAVGEVERYLASRTNRRRQRSVR